jgi:hypothetical protein
MELIKAFINGLTAPYFLITIAAILLFVSLKYADRFYTNKSAAIVFGFMFLFLGLSVLDPNFRLIVTKPDNVPIVGMLFLVPFVTARPFATISASKTANRSSSRKKPRKRF